MPKRFKFHVLRTPPSCTLHHDKYILITIAYQSDTFYIVHLALSSQNCASTFVATSPKQLTSYHDSLTPLASTLHVARHFRRTECDLSLKHTLFTTIGKSSNMSPRQHHIYNHNKDHCSRHCALYIKFLKCTFIQEVVARHI